MLNFIIHGYQRPFGPCNMIQNDINYNSCSIIFFFLKVDFTDKERLKYKNML